MRKNVHDKTHFVVDSHIDNLVYSRTEMRQIRREDRESTNSVWSTVTTYVPRRGRDQHTVVRTYQFETGSENGLVFTTFHQPRTVKQNAKNEEGARFQIQILWNFLCNDIIYLSRKPFLSFIRRCYIYIMCMRLPVLFNL
jgi:hypothetical protein